MYKLSCIIKLVLVLIFVTPGSCRVAVIHIIIVDDDNNNVSSFCTFCSVFNTNILICWDPAITALICINKYRHGSW